MVLEYILSAVQWLQSHPFLVIALAFFLWQRWRRSGPFPEGPEGHQVKSLTSTSEWKKWQSECTSGTERFKLVIIDCYATWCPPCRTAAPIFGAMSKEAKYSNVRFAKTNVDESPDLAREFEVTAMPTFKLFAVPKDPAAFAAGKMECVGTQRGWSEAAIRKMIDDALRE